MREEKKIWISLVRQTNDFRDKHGFEATSLMLDSKIVKTAFFVVDYALKQDDFFNHICSRKFNLMVLLSAYTPMVNRGKLKKAELLTREEKYGLKEEAEKWANHGYSLGQMMKIVYTASHIVESINFCNETKEQYILI